MRYLPASIAPGVKRGSTAASGAAPGDVPRLPDPRGALVRVGSAGAMPIAAPHEPQKRPSSGTGREHEGQDRIAGEGNSSLPAKILGLCSAVPAE